MLDYLHSIGFDTKYIDIDETHPTGTVKVTLDENKIPCFVISPASSYDYITLNGESEKLLSGETEILYFGTLTARDIVSRQTVLSILNNNKIKYFCDLNLRHNFFSKELVEKMLVASNVVKINEAELEKLKHFFNLDQSNSGAVHQLLIEYDIDLIAVTFGEKGAELYNKYEMNKYKIDTQGVVDSLGAGDAYAAILCLGYLKDLPIDEINKLANEFAVEICKVSGALPEDDSVYQKYRQILS
jgi:fructokinase